MGKRASSQIKVQHSNSNYSLRKASPRIIGACSIIIFLITFILYTPVLKNGFVNWDDNEYVYENSYIRALNPHTLSWMLTTFHASNWHPMTWFSHATDYAIWGLNPFGHHLTSIILHGLNTLLVFLLVTQLMLIAKKNPSASLPSLMFLPLTVRSMIVASVTALLFGVHPLHVESVAWVAERKDVLCAFFFLLSLLSYLCFAASISIEHRWKWFASCLTLFVFALTSKPMAVTLPLVLLLLDIYPLKRFTHTANKSNTNQSALFEKIPFLALSLASGIITIRAQLVGGAIQNFVNLPISTRLINALDSPIFYLQKMIWPRNLVPFYPFARDMHFFNPQHIILGIVVLLFTGCCLLMLKRRHYLFFTVWSFYLITLLPVLGIIQVGSQKAADRYTYLPSIGIFLLAGMGVSWVLARGILTKNKIILGGLILVGIITSFCHLTIKQIKIWQNSEILWSYVIKSFPGRIAIAHTNLGRAYDIKGMSDKAISEYEKALAIDPNQAHAHNNLGFAYYAKGMFDEAIAHYEKAVVINPNIAKAYYNLGDTYYTKGMFDEAIAQYQKTLAINPNLAEAYHNLGSTYYAKGMFDEAIAQYQKALAINPNLAEAYNNLGLAYYNKGNYSLAKGHFDKALALGYKVDPKLLESIKPDR